VDDEADARDLIRVLLEERGASVRTAGSAVEALDAFSDAAPDVLISDIGMQDMDGLALIQRVRAAGHETSRIPAIALTAFARSEDRTRAMLAGYNLHLAKPIEPAELVAAVASLAGRTGHSAKPIAEIGRH
jgi:CheY-like chemotaxis protein